MTNTVNIDRIRTETDNREGREEDNRYEIKRDKES